jgi:hypothetical protein
MFLNKLSNYEKLVIEVILCKQPQNKYYSKVLNISFQIY